MNINRFKDADFMQIPPMDILFVGLGGIGFGTAKKLLDCQQKLTIFEPDTVSEHNCIPQGFTRNQIGQTKFKCLEDYLKGFVGNNAQIEYYIGKYQNDSIAYPIMVSAVDNYETRKIMFHNWKQQEDRELFVDGRLLAEFFQVFAITPENEDWYETNFLNGTVDENDGVACTYQQTSFVASIIHGVMTQKILNYGTRKPFSRLTEYNGIIDSFRSE